MSDQHVFSRRKAIEHFLVSPPQALRPRLRSLAQRPRTPVPVKPRRSAARRVHSTFLVTARWFSGNHAWEPGPGPNSLPR